MSTITTVTVEGMTCDHCVAAVRGELERLPGVLSAAVDLGTGRVDITSDAPVDPAAIATAVDEAGFELAS